MKRTILAMLGICLIILSSCTKNSGTTTAVVPATTTFTLYGTMPGDVLMMNPGAGGMTYQGQVLTFAATLAGSGDLVISSKYGGYVRAAFSQSPSGGASLRILTTTPTLFASSYYASH